MRLLALLFLALSLATSALAQDTTGNETSATNETPSTNETVANETPDGPAGPITIEIEGYQDDAGTYFALKGGSARNPAIAVAPGQQVTFVFTAVSGFHNLNVNNGEAKTKTIGDGESETITWTAPAEGGRLEYACDPHKGAGMKGTIAVGAAPAPDAGDDAGAITGDTIDLGQYDPACAGKVAPAAVAEGVVGAPTLQDYIDECTPQEGPVVVAKSGADYVIPLSWALLGVGVLGVVWVHKYYKP